MEVSALCRAGRWLVGGDDLSALPLCRRCHRRLCARGFRVVAGQSLGEIQRERALPANCRAATVNLPNDMNHTLRFDQAPATQAEFSGGKGANLSLLTQRGLPVPRGFIVTAPVYRKFIAGAADLLKDVGEISVDDPA